jgi:hypothetical protein
VLASFAVIDFQVQSVGRSASIFGGNLFCFRMGLVWGPLSSAQVRLRSDSGPAQVVFRQDSGRIAGL